MIFIILCYMGLNSRCGIYDLNTFDQACGKIILGDMWHYWTCHMDEIAIQRYHINRPHMINIKFIVSTMHARQKP